MNMNNCSFVGRLTADAELSYTNSNVAFSKFRIAINDRRRDHTTFVTVVVFGKQAEGISEYLTKGKLVGVEGALEIKSYESEGQKRESVSIIANNVQLGPKKTDD